MSGIVVPPDFVSAIVDHLRTIPEVVAWAPAERIATHVPDRADVPQNWIVVAGNQGGGQIGNGPYSQPNVAVVTFGTDATEASIGSRIVRGALAPVGKSRRIHRQECVIPQVWVRSGPIASMTPTGAFPYELTVYGLVVLEEPVPA